MLVVRPPSPQRAQLQQYRPLSPQRAQQQQQQHRSQVPAAQASRRRTQLQGHPLQQPQPQQQQQQQQDEDLMEQDEPAPHGGVQQSQEVSPDVRRVLEQCISSADPGAIATAMRSLQGEQLQQLVSLADQEDALSLQMRDLAVKDGERWLKIGQQRDRQLGAEWAAQAAVTEQYGSIGVTYIRDSTLALWQKIGLSKIRQAIAVLSVRGKISLTSTGGSDRHVKMADAEAAQLCWEVVAQLEAKAEQAVQRTALADAVIVGGPRLDLARAEAAALALPGTMHRRAIAVEVAATLTGDQVVAVGIFNSWLKGKLSFAGYGCEVAAAKDEDTRIKLFDGVPSPTGKPLAEWTAHELYSAVPGDLGGLGKVLHSIGSSEAGERSNLVQAAKLYAEDKGMRTVDAVGVLEELGYDDDTTQQYIHMAAVSRGATTVSRYRAGEAPSNGKSWSPVLTDPKGSGAQGGSANYGPGEIKPNGRMSDGTREGKAAGGSANYGPGEIKPNGRMSEGTREGKAAGGVGNRGQGSITVNKSKKKKYQVRGPMFCGRRFSGGDFKNKEDAERVLAALQEEGEAAAVAARQAIEGGKGKGKGRGKG